MEPDVTKRATAYIRVSHESQVDNFSLSVQKEQCFAKATSLEYEIVKVFADEGISAKTIADRPGLLDLIRFVKDRKNNIQAVFVYHSSRLSRNTMDFLTLRAMLSKAGVDLISVNEPISGNSPEEEFLATIMASFNQLDNRIRARNTVNGMKKRFLSGLPMCRPPLGYLRNPDKKHPPFSDPLWFKTLQNMWIAIDREKLSLGDAVRALNKLGLRKFSRQTVQNIFSDKFYYGLMYSKRFNLEIQGLHEPMVNEDMFYRVRQIITGRSPHKSIHKTLREDFALKGILLCDECSRQITAAYSKGRNGKHPYYVCSSRNHKTTSTPRDRIEKIFLEMLKDIKPKPNYLKYYIELLEEKYHNRYKLTNQAHDQLIRDINELEAMLKIVREKNARGVYNDQEYLEMKEEISARLFTKKTALSDTKAGIMDLDTLTSFVKFYLSHLDQIFLKASPEGRVKIAGSIFPKRLTVNELKNRTATLGRQYYQIATSKPFTQFKYPLPDSNRRFTG